MRSLLLSRGLPREPLSDVVLLLLDSPAPAAVACDLRANSVVNAHDRFIKHIHFNVCAKEIKFNLLDGRVQRV